MSNKRLRFSSLSPRLAVALLLSLLVHAWVIGGLDGWLPDDESSGSTMISVELLPPPAPKPVVKSLPAYPGVVPQPHPLESKPVASDKPAEKPTEKQLEPTPEAPSPLAAVETVPLPPAAAIAAAQPDAEFHAEEPLPTGIEEPTPQTPSKVMIDYQILRKGSVAGVEHHSYQVKEDGTYTLTSLAEAKGLLSLALSDLMQKSEGLVTARGLRPATYLYQYGRNADKAQKATLDWQSGVLLMEVGSRRETFELQEGTQDLLSFMYQFMFVPPLQDMRITVTNGKKLKVYNYSFEGEETLQLKMGPVRTLRIGKNSNDGEEKTEIWLAADYHYLPVKISKTEKDGTVTERIATRLQTD